MLAEVRRVGPRLVVSGHVHAAHGAASACGTAFVNAASCGSGGDGTEGYLVEWPPVVVDLSTAGLAGSAGPAIVYLVSPRLTQTGLAWSWPWSWPI